MKRLYLFAALLSAATLSFAQDAPVRGEDNVRAPAIGDGLSVVTATNELSSATTTSKRAIPTLYRFILGLIQRGPERM